MTTINNDYISFKGCNYFRQRLILSCFSGKRIVIEDLRDGLRDYEKDFLELLDRITNGSVISVSDTGKVVKFKPGILNGTSGPLELKCSQSRAIGYLLEPLFMLAPFCKYPVDITFRGVTNNELDPSVDMIRYSLLPVLKKFVNNEEALSLKLIQRGLPPNGNGEVRFTCPGCKALKFKPFQWEDMGKVKKIRGTVFTCNVAPTVGNRVMESAKKVFNRFLTDVYFTCDNSRKKKLSPGYGLCTVAETHKGSVFSTEYLCSGSSKSTSEDNMTPEELGEKAAFLLLEEIYRGGVVDSLAQPLIILFMVLGPRDISKAVFGPLTTNTENFLILIHEFLKVKFQINSYEEPTFFDEKEYRTGAQKLLLACLGIGYSNISKQQI